MWAGKGPKLFDCSGAVTCSLHEAGGPDWRHTHNAAALFSANPPIAKPQPGDLAFWGSPVSHVAVVMGEPTEDSINSQEIISADGASSGVDFVQATADQRCRVRRHSSIESTGRSHFRGFRRFSELDV
jgi:murein DD-endopeptidase